MSDRTPLAAAVGSPSQAPSDALTHLSIQFPPSIERLLRHADLAHRIRYRHPLPLQNLNLPKFRYYLFGLLLSPSHRRFSNLWDKIIPAGGSLAGGYVN